jgi:hypothetical protein
MVRTPRTIGSRCHAALASSSTCPRARRRRRLDGIDEGPLVRAAGACPVRRVHPALAESARRLGERSVERREDRPDATADGLHGVDREEHDRDQNGDAGADQRVLQPVRGEPAGLPVDPDEQRSRDACLHDDERLACEEQRDAHRDEDDHGHLDASTAQHPDEEVADADADRDPEHEEHRSASSASGGEAHRDDRDDRGEDGPWMIQQPDADLP